jgi:hypothetical protein
MGNVGERVRTIKGWGTVTRMTESKIQLSSYKFTAFTLKVR